MNTVIEKTLLDADQQMIGRHAEDMGLGAMLKLVKGRLFREQRLERGKQFRPG